MTYDEERRALAAQLRDFESARSFGRVGWPGSLIDADELLKELFDDACCTRCLGTVEFVDSCAVLNLADLIDRHSCRNVSEDPGVFECGECGYSIILDSPYGVCGPVGHCPGCGGTVTEDAAE